MMAVRQVSISSSERMGMISSTTEARWNARSVCASMGLSPSGKNCFATALPILLPIPAAGMSTVTLDIKPQCKLQNESAFSFFILHSAFFILPFAFINILFFLEAFYYYFKTLGGRRFHVERDAHLELFLLFFRHDTERQDDLSLLHERFPQVHPDPGIYGLLEGGSRRNGNGIGSPHYVRECSRFS